jgi:hypothetical protein
LAGLAGCRGAADDGKTHSGVALGLPWRVARAAAVCIARLDKRAGRLGAARPRRAIGALSEHL